MFEKKFGRNYILQVGTVDGGILTVTLPFTIEFDITRNTLSSANVCQVRLYNLSETNRNRLRYNITNFGGPYRPLVLRAGYGNNMAEIFVGNVSQAWSTREGTNYVTQIECYDGGFAFINAVTDLNAVEGTPYRVIAENLIKDLPHVKRGAIGNIPGSLRRGNSLTGSTVKLLNDELANGRFFIDKEKAYLLASNEYYVDPGGVVFVSSDSGLLDTPILEQNIVRFNMLFEPNLNVGTVANLVSTTAKHFTGTYKVTAVKHRGTISDAVAGDCTTSAEFFFDTNLTPVA